MLGDKINVKKREGYRVREKKGMNPFFRFWFRCFLTKMDSWAIGTSTDSTEHNSKYCITVGKCKCNMSSSAHSTYN